MLQEIAVVEVGGWLEVERRITTKFDRTLKNLLEFEAPLIAASQEEKRNLIFWFLKNIQPISVGV
ncbi:hypothetical protein [Acidovorax sacchari]|uniref:hypothetical protein n=1 Tax=Acidovorax sacchari TaxID=3230736 RepID=UPI0039E3130C